MKPLVAGESHARTRGASCTSSSIAGVGDAGVAARLDLGARQIAEPQQQIVHRVGRARVKARRQVLQLLLERVEHGLVEQIAQLGVADQLAQLRLIDRQRLRAPLGQRRIAVVDVVGDVAEQQRRRERRRLLRFDVDDAQRAAAHAAQQVGQRRQIEDVAQALAIGLEDDRKRSEPRRDRQQIRRRACAAARAARARRAGGAAAAARGRRLRETAPRTSPSIRAAARPAARPRRDRAAAATCRAAARHPDTAPRTHRPTTSPRRRCRARRGCARWPPSPTARGRGCRTASAPRRASRRDRRAIVRSRSCDRRARRRPRLLIVEILEQVRGGQRVEAVIALRAWRAPPAARALRRSRTSLPIAMPSSTGRPGPSPFQNGILPGSPGAGDTSTRSCVI